MGMKADRSQDTSKPGTMRSFTPQSKKISKEHANYGNTENLLFLLLIPLISCKQHPERNEKMRK